jgi:hypothetical protein
MGDWLGTGTVARRGREHRPFQEAREFVQRLGLKNATEWRKYCQGKLPEKGMRPQDIPAAAPRIYSNKGWISWGDWLGTGTVALRHRKFRPFDDARIFVRALGLKSQAEWRKYCSGELSDKGTCPQDIPRAPYHSYKNQGWISMGDWLGTGTVAPQRRRFRSFKIARAFVHKLKLKSQSEWRKWCGGKTGKGTRPVDIPSTPEREYKNQGWISMGDWLGAGTVAIQRHKFRS